MSYGLSQQTVESLSEIFRTYPEIHDVILYGSRAKGTFNDGSDIDICLKGENLDTSVLHKISNDIDNLLLPWLFDISIYETINNTDLLNHINRVGKTIYTVNP